MIVYSKKFWGFGLLTSLNGSAIPRALLFASISTGIVALLKTVGKDYFVSGSAGDDEVFFMHPYPF